MGLVTHSFIEKGQQSEITDCALLDSIASATIESDNITDGSVNIDHLFATRAATAIDCTLPITRWIATKFVDTGTQVITNDNDPGDTVSLGSDLELVCDPRVRLTHGSVLRWHANLKLTEVDDVAPDEDMINVLVRIRVYQTSGLQTKSAFESPLLGIVHRFSMNQARLASTSDGAGSNKEIEDRYISLSGVYIHDDDSGLWANPGYVDLDSIKVSVFVETALNSVTISNGRLTAMIVK